MKRKKRLIVASLIVAAGVVQSACSANIGATETADASTPVETASPQPPSDKSTDDADTAAEEGSREAESVIPPLGSFDRRDPVFIQYKPCLEMPDEFLEEAGLYGKEMLEGVGESDGVCMFSAKPEHGQAVFKLVGSSHDFNTYGQIPGEVSWEETSEGTSIMLLRDEYLADSACRALIETTRGTLGAVFQSFEYVNEANQYDPCVQASSLLKTILELDGKNGY